MKLFKWVAAAALLFSMVSGASAEKFLQLSLWPSAQIVNPDESVAGLRLSIYGENQNMSGLDLGIANVTKGDWMGVGLSLINWNEGNVSGVQWAPWGYGRVAGDVVGWHSATFGSNVRGDFTGLQGSLISLTAGSFTGVQGGLVSITSGDFSGWQLGAYTQADAGQFTGLQTGIVNRANSVKGVQIGLLNITDDMYGIQVGLFNILQQGKLRFFPIVNAKF